MAEQVEALLDYLDGNGWVLSVRVTLNCIYNEQEDEVG